MRSILFSILLSCTAFMCSCDKDSPSGSDPYGDGPRTEVAPALRGTWMYGNFSLTEYWSQNPEEYIDNAYSIAIAFKFNANGTYEHYFTYKSYIGGVATYHQSVTKGIVVVDEANKTITTHAKSARYKQTKNGRTVEDRDLRDEEITKVTNYTYEEKTEPNGTNAIYLKMNGQGEALAFLKKF